MIANAALLAVLSTFLVVGWLAGELQFLAPYKGVLFRSHGREILGATLVVFLNLCALYYGLGRWLLLRDTGRKLRHVDHQLRTADRVLDQVGDDLPV